MLCQHCKSKEATTHVKSIVNGEYEEHMLCSECAKKMGYANILSDIHSDFDSILGTFFSNALPAHSGAARCSVCGSTYHDIATTGKVGCANCYETFLDEMMPTIRRIHGNTAHCGKHPEVDAQADKDNSADVLTQINKLKVELEKAIKEQKFELAAELRDKIKETEESK